MIQDLINYVLIGLVLGLIFMIFQWISLKRRLDLFSFGKNENLEESFKELRKGFEEMKKEIEEIKKRITLLEKIGRISFQKSGVVRYNPFRGSGGNQSFSVALLDRENSGFVITSLYIKEGQNRIFAKPVKEGKSEYLLSEEEKKAIEEAMRKGDF